MIRIKDMCIDTQAPYAECLQYLLADAEQKGFYHIAAILRDAHEKINDFYDELLIVENQKIQ